MKNLVNSGVRRKRGVSTLEFALVFPIFIMLIFALIDFSMYYYMESSMTSVVRMALRTGVTGKKYQDPNNPGSGTNINYLTRKQAVLMAAQTAAQLPLVKFRSSAYGATNTANFNSDLITFVTTTNDGATYQTNLDDLGGSGARIKMTFEQDFQFLTPLVRWLNTNNVTTNRMKVSTSYKAEDFDIN